MNKLELDCPSFEDIKKTISSSPDEIVMTFENKADNIEEFAIISFLVNDAGYTCYKFKPVYDSKEKYIAMFKKKT